jgi:hypothetical protein
MIASNIGNSYNIENNLIDDKGAWGFTISNNNVKEHVSFRIEKNYLMRLHSEAKQNNISLNVLINQIIRQYLEWYSIASKIGEIPMQKSILSMFIEKLDASDLVDIARNAADMHFKNVILMFKSEFTVSAWIEALESWIKVAGFPYKHETDSNQHSFIIQHDMGNKFSIFEKELLETVFNMFKIKPEFDLTNNNITFKFNLN